MRNAIRATLLSLLIISPAVATAADASAGSGFDVVAPYLDEQTIAVGCVDLSRINLDVIESIALRFADSMGCDPDELAAAKKEIAEARKVAADGIDSTRKAGVTRIFFVLSVADIPERELPFLVMPAGRDADLRVITALLLTGRADGPVTQPADTRGAPYPNLTVERVGPSIFAGSKETLDRVRDQKPADLPELAKAFEAAGDAAVRIALAPTTDARRVFEEMVPHLPEVLGGGPITALTRGFRWLSIGLDTSPALAGRMLVQSQSPDAAQALRGIALKALAALKADAGKALPDMDFDRICKLLTPEAQGDRLTLALTEERMNALLGELLTPSLRRARLAAQRAQSASNLKQMMMALYMHGADHKDSWAESLQTLVAAKLIPESVVINPQCPSRKDAYVYVRPPVPMNKVNPMTLVIYEAHDKWGEGIHVAFADGHVEFIRDEARFRDALAKATATPPAKP